MKEERGDIERFLQEKLQNIEVPVNTELWKGIAQNIPAVKVSSSIISKGLIYKLVAATVLVGGVSTFAYLNQKEDLKPVIKVDQKQKAEQEVYTPVEADKNQDVKKDELFAFPEVKDKSTVESTSNSFRKKQIVSQQQEVILPIKDEVVSTASNDKESVVSINSQRSDIGIQTEIIETTEDTKAAEESTEELIIQNTDIIESTPKGEISHFPNIFSPNGDASNDYLFIQSRNLMDFNAVVLDSSGKVVYRSSDADFKWNGRGNNGELVPSGKYILYVVAKDGRGNTISQSGSLMITY